MVEAVLKSSMGWMRLKSRMCTKQECEKLEIMARERNRSIQGFFVTVRGGTAYREMKMTKVYFVCQYCISM